ncbi:MAG: hypothetical protein JW867_05295 [Candidatus Omnitrophica bacterium]|nr:hypothetical protein [Candidatus Omnitrophota bacterium]
MGKITINLNPQKEAAPSDVIKSITSYTPFVIIGALVVLLISSILLFVSFGKNQAFNSLNQKWSHWENKASIINQVKTNIASLDTERLNIEEVVTPEYEMSPILGDIFASLPNNIWFESFKFQDGFLSLRGYVVKWPEDPEDHLAYLDTFIHSLRNTKYFSKKFKKLNIKESQKATYNNVEVLRFIIECKS